MKLHAQLQQLLTQLRTRRGFSSESYLEAKSSLLNSYFARSGLSSAVVGVSGGVDSALTLAMLVHASRQIDSPLKRIVALLLPYFIDSGTTNQEDATARGREVAEHYGVQCILADLSSSHERMKHALDSGFGITGDAWASGQLVSYLRTPALFYATSLLTQLGLPSLLVGTTNRDEGGFIGYFGKAADAMVDLQLISDIHKSEVYELSSYLDVPRSVLNAAPHGDIYDGRNDEQLIGAPYDFIELYTLLRCLESSTEREHLLSGLGVEASTQFEQFAARLELLNRQNTHKYLAGSTAVHLDVYERAVPGGWSVPHQSEAPIDRSRFVNPVELGDTVLSSMENNCPQVCARESQSKTTENGLGDFGSSAMHLNSVLTPEECASIRNQLGSKNWVPVGRNGMLKDYDAAKDIIGSWRASTYDERLARILWARIAPRINRLRLMSEYSQTDWDDTPAWRAVGINPLMRFIRYSRDGLLVPHYDAPYIYNQDKRTLMSLVLYLTGSDIADGGATRFIEDPQTEIPLAERDLSDWTNPANPAQVLLEIRPVEGSVLMFDHRILHDSENYSGTAAKIIMRTDIVFERCGLPDKREITISRPLGLPEATQNSHPSKNRG